MAGAPSLSGWLKPRAAAPSLSGGLKPPATRCEGRLRGLLNQPAKAGFATKSRGLQSPGSDGATAM